MLGVSGLDDWAETTSGKRPFLTGFDRNVILGTDLTNLRISATKSVARAKFVYTGLRDSIALFSIGEGCTLMFAGEAWTRSDHPCPREISFTRVTRGATRSLPSASIEKHQPEEDSHQDNQIFHSSVAACRS